MSFERFPYTNFHELNLDWVVKHSQEALDKANAAIEEIENAVKTVNTVSPDASGNVSINDADIPYSGDKLSVENLQEAVDGLYTDISGVDDTAVKEVNGHTPGSQGAVTVAAEDVPYQNTELRATNVEDALDALADREPGDVSSVNGITPGSGGNVLLPASGVPVQSPMFTADDVEGALEELQTDLDSLADDAVISVNGVTVDASGNVTLPAHEIPVQNRLFTADDVDGALEELHESVADIEDAMVKSVNNIQPGTDGDVAITAQDIQYQGAVGEIQSDDVGDALSLLTPLIVEVHKDPDSEEWVASHTFNEIEYRCTNHLPIEVWLTSTGGHRFRLPPIYYYTLGVTSACAFGVTFTTPGVTTFTPYCYMVLFLSTGVISVSEIKTIKNKPGIIPRL